MSQNVKIGLVIGCLVLAAGILYVTTLRGSGGGSLVGGDQIWLKCVSPDCNQASSVSASEFQKMLTTARMQNKKPLAVGAAQPLVCPKCGKLSAYVAHKCEKCGDVFLMQSMLAMPTDASQDFADRCPKCGYSSLEAQGKKGQ
jgi:ribosomal protein L40E